MPLKNGKPGTCEPLLRIFGVRFYLQTKKVITIILHLKKIGDHFDEVGRIINNFLKRYIWKAKKSKSKRKIL